MHYHPQNGRWAQIDMSSNRWRYQVWSGMIDTEWWVNYYRWLASWNRYWFMFCLWAPVFYACLALVLCIFTGPKGQIGLECVSVSGWMVVGLVFLSVIFFYGILLFCDFERKTFLAIMARGECVDVGIEWRELWEMIDELTDKTVFDEAMRIAGAQSNILNVYSPGGTGSRKSAVKRFVFEKLERAAYDQIRSEYPGVLDMENIKR